MEMALLFLTTPLPKAQVQAPGGPGGSPAERRLLGSLRISPDPEWDIPVGPSRMPGCLAVNGESLPRRLPCPS